MSDIGKKYKQAGQHWLRIDKKLIDTDGKLRLVVREIPKRKDTENKVTETYSYLYNQISNFDTHHDNSPGDLNKPVVTLEMIDKHGKIREFDALIDPGSYSLTSNSSSLEIVSYISDKLYNNIINEIPNNKPCTCAPTKPCTATGCFISTTCIFSRYQTS